MIYLDNAATSWPKPESVWAAMEECMKYKGANPGRGGHKMALDAGRVVYRAREAVANLFGIDNPIQVVFTLNATEAINIGLKGFLRPGDHVITSSMEHNSVTRPLAVLRDNGVEISEIDCTPYGYVKSEDVEKAIKTNTKLIIVTHASNVTGTIMPIKEIGDVAKKRNIAFMIDASQTAGLLDINVNEINVDMIAFPGHKGLLGPQGTGGLYLREGIDLTPLKEGGTGSESESLYQPSFLPDKLECGTPNTVGLAGLTAGVNFLLKEGIQVIREKEIKLMSKLIEGMSVIKRIKIYGDKNIKNKVSVLSFNFSNQDSAEISYVLDQVFNIATRAGLHCSPAAHKTIGTLDTGTVRISLSYFNTEKDIDETLIALNKIAAEI